MLKRLCLLTLMLLVPEVGRCDSNAFDDVTTLVITPNRMLTPLRRVAASTTVISAEEIRLAGYRTVEEALRSVPSVDVVQSGARGGNTSVFIRGANSEHTLVLVDGVEANNPASTNRSFNFVDLSVDNVDRIEVIRGPQSTLYGSDAIGGVINIITKKGDGAPRASFSFEGGSYTSFLERAHASGSTPFVNFSLGASREDTHGVSAASQRLGNDEHDPYHNTSFSSQIGLTPAQTVDVNLSLRANHSHSDIDESGGVGADDLNRNLVNEEIFGRGEVVWRSLDDGRLEHVLGVSVADHDLNDRNDPDDLQPVNFLRSTFEGKLTKFDLLNKFQPQKELGFLLGFETEQEKASSESRGVSGFGAFMSEVSERSTRSNAAFFQLATDVAGFSLTTGGRVDNSNAGPRPYTWRFAPAYEIAATNTKLAMTVGTGFKAPSLFQLYSEFGNQSLENEKSLGVDVTLEQGIADDRARVGITGFYNRFKNLITFDSSTFVFQNVSRAKSSGVEVYSSLHITDDFDGKLTYTYLDTKDDDTDEALLRRARGKARAELTYRLPKATLATQINFVGRRRDNDFSTFPAQELFLGSYTTVNASGEYRLTDSMTLFARLENIFDREYEEVFGFGTRGFGAYGGARISF